MDNLYRVRVRYHCCRFGIGTEDSVAPVAFLAVERQPCGSRVDVEDVERTSSLARTFAASITALV